MLLRILILSCLLLPLSAAEVDPFLEQFALGDRAAALKDLIPGSADFYFYHALDAQHRGDRQRFDQLIADWRKQIRSNQRRDALLLRQAIIDYSQDPQASIQYLCNELHIRFDHRPPDSGHQADLPTVLDQSLISYQAFLKEIQRRHGSNSWSKGFEEQHLCFVDASSFSSSELRHYLRRLPYPEAPKLVQLIVRELRDRHSGGFGSLPIHDKLLEEQLIAVARMLPQLNGNSRYISARLRLLQPRDGSSWRIDPQVYGAYLDRLWTFADSLPASQNSLKANILYHRLVHDRSQAVFDRKRFERYIALPRSAVYINRDYLKRFRRDHVNLNASFISQTTLSPIGNDLELVRSYLEYFYASGTPAEAFHQYLSQDWCAAVYAETMVLNGQGDQERWAAQLGAETYRAIQQRIELGFTPQNQTRFMPGEAVRLQLRMKNIDKLLVRMYPINTEAWYRDQQRPVPQSFDVDGLVTDLEQQLEFKQHPAHRHAANIQLDEIQQRGVYIVECLGNGYRCRSLIRIGDLRVRERIGTAGHVFRVYDEQHQLLKDALLQLGQQRFTADKDGSILVPFATAAGNKQLIVSHGDFAVRHQFHHQQEQYRLRLQAHIDRQDALAGQLAQLSLATQLFLHDEPVSLDDLENLKVTMHARTIDGVDAREIIDDVKLNEVDLWTHDLRFPDRVTALTVSVHAEIEHVSTGERQQLSASQRISCNGMLSEQQFKDVYLRRHADGYSLDILGRNGEAYPDKEVVRVTLKHRDFKTTIMQQLRTDDKGSINLGQLKDIESVSVHFAGRQRNWQLLRNELQMARELHVKTGETLRLAFPEDAAALHACHLYSLRSRHWQENLRQQLSLNQDGRLQISGLQPGDYQLFLPYRSRPLHISVEDAVRQDAQLFGEARILSDLAPHGLHISGISADQQNLRIQVSGHSAATRVHVLFSRYLDRGEFIDRTTQISPRSQSEFYPAPISNDYLDMRRLSDEHRYVLDRAYQDVFPTLSLRRPALLLHPWERAATHTGHIQTQEGESFDDEADRRGMGRRRAVSRHGGSRASISADPIYDFLRFGSVVLCNLAVDQDGSLRIPRNLLVDQSYVQVVACEPEQAVARSFALSAADLQRRERSFAPQRDTAAVLRQDKRVATLAAGAQIDLDLDPNAWRVLDSFGQAFDLLDTLCDDQRLADFHFLKRWPSFSDEEKDRYYSEHACHELHVFLYHKDQAFFNAVVKPTLANKHDKTFIDYYLLEADLSHFTSAWAFERLNTFERVLLLKRLQSQHDPVLRWLRESVAVMPPNQQQRDHLFHTALRGKSLDGREMLKADKDLGDARADQTRRQELARLKAVKEKTVEMLEVEGQLAEDAMPAAPAAQEVGAGYFARDRKAGKKQIRRLYRQIDKTKEWAENNYYKRYPHEQLADLIPVNAYWLDYAQHADGDFLSTHLAEAHHSASDVLMALAVLDLPFNAEQHAVTAGDQQQQLSLKSPAIVYYIDVVAAAMDAENEAVVVTQQLYRQSDRYRYEDGVQIERFVQGDLLYRDLYGLQIVVSNTTARPQHIDLLMQIPQGAIALAAHPASQSKALVAGAYSVQRFDILFYFPETGEVQLQAATASSRQQIIGRAASRALQVVADLPDVDKDSWQYIADYGSDDAVLDYLRTHNSQRLDLERIAFRMQDAAMYQQTIAVLTTARRYVPVLWSYAFKHNDQDRMRAWLAHNQEVVRSCGAYLHSDLLTLDAVERHHYEHLEYYPLVNARTHALAGDRHIANAALATQYQRFLESLCYLPQLREHDHLAAVVYLLTQDRISDALDHFEQLEPGDFEQQLQYDYCKAYVLLLQGDVDTAAAISERYQDYAIKHWRDRFIVMRNQIAELKQGQTTVRDDPERNQDMEARAAREAMLDLETSGDQITVHHRNIDACSVRIYRMNLELLFSRSPFMRGDGGQFAYIAPNHQEQLTLAADKLQTAYKLPQDYRQGNVLLEVQAAGLTRRRVLFVHQLHVLTQDNYGQLQVRQRTNQEVVTRAYVKVYARMKNGQVKYYKDGYTDFRGRFDYGALSTNDLDNVERFSLFISHPEYGALVREVAPPQR